MASADREFYVGYEPRSPRKTGRRMRLTVALMLALGLAFAVMWIAGQGPFDDGVFEFGVERDFVGRLIERPYPVLLVPEGGPHLLVGTGKRGANERVEGLDGRTVRVSGSAIHDGSNRMIELHAIETTDDGATRADHSEERSLGSMTLTGEIVDSKCYLGVMKPGRGKVHKACAVRCISGGSPPALRVEDESGRVELFLLVSSDGESVQRQVLDLVAEPVEITGRVVRRDGLLVLYADPATYRRVGS